MTDIVFYFEVDELCCHRRYTLFDIGARHN